jgi:hypothetical protein
MAQPNSNELPDALRACRRYFATALIFSLAINLLYLAGPLYMLQVYDRVINSASGVTLVMLTLVLLVAVVALAGLDLVRARVLTRASTRLDRLVAGRVLAATMDGAIWGAPPRLVNSASCCWPRRSHEVGARTCPGRGASAATLRGLDWADGDRHRDRRRVTGFAGVCGHNRSGRDGRRIRAAICGSP